MRRRELSVLGGGAAWPLPSRAQQPSTIARVGFTTGKSPVHSNIQTFEQGLRELGYSEGTNIVLSIATPKGTHRGGHEVLEPL